MTSPVARVALWLILLLTCGVPLIWTALVIANEPRTLIAAMWDVRLASLFGRTVLFASLSSLGALLIALPIAIAMGRSYSRVARALWWVVPLPLLMPSIVVGYGWSEVLSRLGVVPMPQSNVDVARCVLTLSAWLWPIPAVLIGLALRRTDHALLEQAALDGVLTRVLVRRALAPAIVAGLVSVILAMQEFAIFEPTGISVMATEVRMIFETGLLSSSSNPIASLVGGVGTVEASSLSDQAALALAAGAPVIGLTAFLCASAYALVGRLRMDDAIDISPPSQNVRAHGAWTLAAWLVVAGVILTPVLTMAWVANPPFDPVRVGVELQPQLIASLLIAGATGAVGIVLASLAAIVPPRAAVGLAVVSFLLGGQFTAIAILRVASDSDIGAWLRDTNVVVVMAHVARFAWIALLAGSTLHSGAWRGYREMAGVDGAGAWQTLLRVIVGVGWPVLGLAGLLMFALSLTEVPATALLVPPSLVPLLLSWVHQQRYGPMMNASLMLTLVVVMIGWVSMALWMIGKRRNRGNDVKA